MPPQTPQDDFDVDLTPKKAAGASPTVAQATRSTVDGQGAQPGGGDQRGFGQILGDAYSRLTNWDQFKQAAMPGVSLRDSWEQVKQGAIKTGKDLISASAPVIGHRVLQSVGLAKPGDLYQGETPLRGLPPAMMMTFAGAGGFEGPPEAGPRPVNVKGPGEIAPEMTRPQAYPQPAQPIPARTGLALPGQVTDQGAVYNVDALRGKLTSPEAQVVRGGSPSNALGEIPVPKGPGSLPSVGLGEQGTTAGEKQAAARFKTSNPSALGRLPRPVEASAGETPGGPSSTTERVTSASEPAKLEKPSAKPVEAKPKPDSATRRVGYLFGEHAEGFNPENPQHLKIERMTHEQLAQAANERGLKGKKWTAGDFARTSASHGKSSNPNASYVRGYLLEEANMKPVGGGSGAGEHPNFPTAESRRASDLAFGKRYPNEGWVDKMDPIAGAAWDESLGFKKPTVDVGKAARSLKGK